MIPVFGEVEAILKDTGGRIAVITADGALTVLMRTSPPAGKTAVSRSLRGTVSGNQTVLDTWVIPDGETLTVQIFQAGAQDYSNCTRVTLYYAPAGTLNGTESIIASHYVNGSSMSDVLFEEITGNGTRALILERKRMGAGAIEVFGRWAGYY